MTQTSTPYPPGARIVVREAEWMVRSCTTTEHDGYKIRATGVSELVRDEDAVFFTELENPKPLLLKPEETVLVPDQTPRFAMSRLFLEATLRRTPLPQSERGLALPDRFLLDPLTYQQRPAELALKGLRPRILLADVVGLGKTLEIGLILAELIRRGRGDRILVVTPQQVLEQFQQELWTRFAIPLIRLDSVGIQRIQREIPAGRNPFTFYKRIIISIDTLKGDAYRHHLDNMQLGRGRHRRVAQPHRGDQPPQQAGQAARPAHRRPAAGQRHPAQRRRGVLRRADQHARPGRHRRQAQVRAEGHRAPLHPPHQDQPRGDATRSAASGASAARPRPVRCPATPKEERVFDELTATWLGSHAPGVTSERRLFPYTLLKAFLSSHKALAKTAENRLKNADRRAREASARPRSGSSPRRSPTTTPPSSPRWSASSGKSASARQLGPRGRLLRERPHPQVAARGTAEAARAHQAGPGRHHARRVLRRRAGEDRRAVLPGG